MKSTLFFILFLITLVDIKTAELTEVLKNKPTDLCKKLSEICESDKDCCTNCCALTTNSTKKCHFECPNERIVKVRSQNTIVRNVDGKLKNKTKQEQKFKTTEKVSKPNSKIDFQKNNQLSTEKKIEDLRNDTEETQIMKNENLKMGQKIKTLNTGMIHKSDFEVEENSEIGEKIGPLKVNLQDIGHTVKLNYRREINKNKEQGKTNVKSLDDGAKINSTRSENIDIDDKSAENTEVGQSIHKSMVNVGMTQVNKEIGSSIIKPTKKIIKHNDKLGTSIESKESIEIGEVLIKKIDIKPNERIGTPVLDIDEGDKRKTMDVQIAMTVLNSTKVLQHPDKDIEVGIKPNKKIGTTILKQRDGKILNNEKEKALKEKRPNVEIGESMTNTLKSEVIEKTVSTIDKLITKIQNETIKITDGDQPNREKGVRDILKPVEKVELKSSGSTLKEASGGETRQSVHTTNCFDSEPICATHKSCCEKCCSDIENRKSCFSQCGQTKTDSSDSSIDGLDKGFDSSLLATTIPKFNREALPKSGGFCKATGSTCAEASDCCTQCCAVSDGMFQCFDKGTDECQDILSVKPKNCKKEGDTCRTNNDCCGSICTNCGGIFVCDNEKMNLCKSSDTERRQTSKVCRVLGETCKEATDCCTKCCAVSDGIFQCFEEGTHECQSGDNVSNSTLTDSQENK